MKQRSRRDPRAPRNDATALGARDAPMGEPLQRQSLLHALRRAHVRLGLTAIVAAAAMLTLLSVLTLHTHVERNLALIARSIAYASEAAVMFDDSEAARDAVKAIADAEGLLAANIVRPDGSRLAAYQRKPNRVVAETLSEFGSLIFQLQATAPVMHRGLVIGRVQVRGDGGVYLLYLLEVLAAIGACAAVTAWRVARLSGKVERDVVQPLKLLASLTHRARLARSANLRAPPAGVREIHDLGEDINALLAEVASHEAELVAEHDTLKSANASLSFLAFHDSLTGLPNRARFMEHATRALQLHGARDSRSRCCTSTSITSRRSTIAWAMPPATNCWSRSPRASVPSCATAASSRDWAAMSWPCCWRRSDPATRRPRLPNASPRRSAHRCSAHCSAASNPARASAWPCSPTTAATWTNCSSPPTQRCTAPRGGAPALPRSASGRSRARHARRRSTRERGCDSSLTATSTRWSSCPQTGARMQFIRAGAQFVAIGSRIAMRPA